MTFATGAASGSPTPNYYFYYQIIVCKHPDKPVVKPKNRKIPCKTALSFARDFFVMLV